MQRSLERPEFAEVARSLRQIGFNSAIDLLATYAGRDPELGPWLADAEINRDDNLRLQFLAGFDLNLDQREQTYREMLSYRQYPADLFAGSPASLNALREAILKK
jgi:spermidine synthase